MKPSSSARHAAWVLLALILVSLVLLRSSAAQQTAGQALTTDDVVQMLHGGQTVDQVVAKIRSTPGSYPMLDADVEWLTKHNVPLRVISAMRRRNQANAPVSTPDTGLVPESTGITTMLGDPATTKTAVPPKTKLAPNASAPMPPIRTKATPYDWNLTTTQDKLTDQVTNSLSIKISPPENPTEGFLVGVACNSLNIPLMGELKSVEFSFMPTRESKLHFKLFSYTTNGKAERTLSGSYEVTPAFTQECPQVGLRFGNNKVSYQQSEVCGNDLSAAISFYDGSRAVGKKFKDALGINGQTPLAGPITNIMDSLLANNLLQVPELMHADSFRVALPLSNGQRPVITVPVNDSLRAFANDCIPPPPPVTPVTAMMPSDWSPADGFVFGLGESLEARQFEGTVDEFAAALPGFVHRALAGSGLTRNYDNDVALGIEVVKSCPGMTRQTEAALLRSSVPANRALPQACSYPSMTTVLERVDFHHVRGLEVTHRAHPDGSNWTTMDVRVRFSPMLGDYTGVNSHDGKIDAAGYLIMEATLHR